MLVRMAGIIFMAPVQHTYAILFTFQMDESLDISAVEESIHDATFNDQFECSDCDSKTRYKHNLRRHQQLKGHQQPQMINLPKSSTPLKPVLNASFLDLSLFFTVKLLFNYSSSWTVFEIT